MSRIALIVTATLLAAAALAPVASAHESYQSDDGMFTIVLGEQNEPVYTYDWTNLDFIVSEDSENGTGGPVPGVDETVEATLIAPGGEEMSLPIEPQHGEIGRYQFAQDYFLTQPGQYEVRLEGDINGTNVDGTYLLPGPREAMNGQGFPAETVPSPLKQAERIDQLETQISDLESQLSELESEVAGMDAGDGETAQQGAPGPGAIVALLALAGVAGLNLARRQD